MKTITIEGQIRTEFGKKATRQLRLEEKVPAVIYGGAEEINFAAPATAFKNIVYTPDFMVVEATIGEKKYRCVLKDLQFDKVSDQLIHVDFLELVEDKKVIVTLPLKFTGAPAGVKAGGKLVTKMKNLKVKLLPKYLRENIELDITNLALNENLRVQDVKADNMEIMNSPRIPIASITMTRQLKQEEAAAPKGAAPAKAAPAKTAPAKTAAPAAAKAAPAAKK
ncbi:50S ribosomal protein L25 [Ferruginibacter sp.]|uniref:50S ribosomal protein L25 n=2 Tax=Ferruginibacter sp. TaxID=1940288 RepID=UPI0019CDCB14|nr:50S ribosomal protein L25 [Ferruginibacter sp.]MBC7625952.1 50S ribosomal protein L25 [Ferruginibacter sp.]